MDNTLECLTILTADKSWREDNGKIGLAGIFEHFKLPKFPAQILPFGVYVKLASVSEGPHELVANIVAEKNHAVLSSLTVHMNVPEDQETLQMQFPVPPMVLPGEGTYNLLISVDGVQLARHAMKAQSIRQTS